MLTDAMEIWTWMLLFWMAAVAVFYAFLGYPLLVGLLCRNRPQQASTSLPPSGWPSLTVVLAAYNEASRIRPRLENLLNSNYPQAELDIVVVSDGSTDDTVGAIQSLGNPGVQVLALPRRSGKAACLNAGVAAARGEVVVFADARQKFAPDTLRRLALHFADPLIGAVSGSLEIAPARGGAASGVDAYWRLEKYLRAAEARLDSCIGCTGAVYAIRRQLYQPLPPDTILDDVVIPMQIALQGYRVLHDPEARALDPQPLEPVHERRRKQRTLAGNFQMLFRYPAWLWPCYNRLWWQLLSHKYLRLAAPVGLAMALLSATVLRHHPLYAVMFWLQIVFYLLAAAGLGIRSLKTPIFSWPAGFLFLNLMTLAGLWYYLRRTGQHGWEKAPAST